MAIGRGSMTKELFGNRQKAKKMATGGPTNRGDIAKAATAARKSAAIDAGQKGRTTKTPKTTADMYDRQALIKEGQGQPFTAAMMKFNKHEMGLDTANPPGPQRTAKLTPKKMAVGGSVTPSDMMNQRGRDIAAAAQQGSMKMATNAPSRITPTNPATYAQGTPPMPSPQRMKKGGSVRGCGCATRGKSGAKVY